MPAPSPATPRTLGVPPSRKKGYSRGCVSLDESPPVALDRHANPVHLSKIYARSDDHSSAPVEVMVSRPCFTPLVLIRASAIFLTAPAFPLTTRTSRQLS